MNKEPVFILGCTKSGTSLIRNLFDGHPAVFAAPAESHFFQYTGSWVSYFFRRSQPKNFTYDEMKDQLVKWVDFSNRRSNAVADGFTAGKWSLEMFKEIMFSKPVNNLRELSDLYIEGMYAALHNKPYPNLHFVEKSVENVEFASEWLQLYPNAKFIHILRNPYSNLVAIRKYMNSPRFPFSNRALVSMNSSYYFLYKNLRLINQAQYRVILYEDLLSEPEKIMKQLADFIGIDFAKTLLIPTVFGESWAGNSTSGKSFSGISKLNLERWKKDITKYEIAVVNELFPHVLKDFNFEIINPKNAKAGFLPREGIINHFMNKISYYYLPKPKTAFLDADRKRSKPGIF